MERGMCGFRHWDFQGIEEFSPEAIVAPLGMALALADLKLRGRLSLRDLQTAILVLTDEGEMFSDHHRDLLWRAFGVPVFEQLRDASGRIVARECEVHDGLHLADGRTMSHFNGEVVTGQCECGAETPRLRNRNVAPEIAAAAAA